MVNNPLKRPAVSCGNVAFGEVPLDSHYSWCRCAPGTGCDCYVVMKKGPSIDISGMNHYPATWDDFIYHEKDSGYTPVN